MNKTTLRLMHEYLQRKNPDIAFEVRHYYAPSERRLRFILNQGDIEVYREVSDHMINNWIEIRVPGGIADDRILKEETFFQIKMALTKEAEGILDHVYRFLILAFERATKRKFSFFLEAS